MTPEEVTAFVSADSLLDLSKYNSLPLEDRPTRPLISKDKDGTDVTSGTPIYGVELEDSVLLGASPGKDYFRVASITDKFGIPKQRVVRTLHFSQFSVAKVLSVEPVVDGL